jgi:tetratricopeptide (TPR) repeat protein
MKQLFIALLLLILPMTVIAQDEGVRVPDEEDILRQTLSGSSPYYYTNLMLKYRSGSEKLSADDYFYLYYGYLYQESYRPFVENRALDEMLLLMSGIDIEKPMVKQLEAIIERGMDAMELDPFNPKVLNIMAYAYGALGDKQREQQYFDHLNGVLQTIESSGTGLKESSPWHVLMFSHAYDLLASKGYQYGQSKIISRSVEYIPLTKKSGDKIKGFYFDYSRVYRNKPDDIVIKRDRTWQFNNLKPQEYK